MEKKRKKVRRLDSIRLDRSDSTYFTDEGYLVDHPILTSVGIFEYTNPNGSIRRELRLPKYVFDERSLETYKGKPVIITHEAGEVNKGNVDREQIGTILTNGYQDGDNVRAEIIIHNTDAMKECGLKELSLGYGLELLEEPGEWDGEAYDAIQTNIVINHLALVASARAGEQARLNIDGSDEPELKGGKKAMAKASAVVKRKKNRTDGTSSVMSQKELKKAISDYRAKRAGRTDSSEDLTSDPDNDETLEELEEAAALDDENENEEEGTAGRTPEEIIAGIVKDRKDRRDSENELEDIGEALAVIAQQDEDIDMLLACLEKGLSDVVQGDSDENEDEDDENEDSDENEDEDDEENKDCSDDESKSLNADSADKIFRQRLSICRIGDKLRMDGLENKSILAGKKAIISKVLPNMRMDGKSRAYINATYDLAVAEVNKRKDVSYQRRQMSPNSTMQRHDGRNSSMAASARQRMIDREGGNE